MLDSLPVVVDGFATRGMVEADSAQLPGNRNKAGMRHFEVDMRATRLKTHSYPRAPSVTGRAALHILVIENPNSPS